MSDIPYSDVRLHEAHREGRRTWAEEQTPPMEFFGEDVEEAFHGGYEDGEEGEANSSVEQPHLYSHVYEALLFSSTSSLS